MGLNNEHIAALAKQGAAAWNGWAQQLLKEKGALIAEGTWCLNKNVPYETHGENEPTRAWLDKAAVNGQNWDLTKLDFLDCIFPGPVDLRGAQLTGTNFVSVEFLGRCRFDRSNIAGTSFNAATFHDTAFFNSCVASEEVNFATAVFKNGLWFQGASLTDAKFWRCESEGSVWFDNTVFDRYVNMEWVEFRKFASFKAARFQDAKFLTTSFHDASFERATFEGDVNMRNISARDLSFEGASFNGSTDIRKLRVSRACSFRSVRSTGDIDLEGADFHNPPDFTLSTFRRDPRLDTIRVRRSWFGFYTRPPTGVDATERKEPWFGVWIDEHAPAKFRELKKIAAGSNDAVKELEFHAQEIRSSRFVTDWPFPWPGAQSRGMMRFWCGLFYGLLSDFGQSFIRPLLWWLALGAFCAVAYLSQSPAIQAKRQLLQSEHGVVLAFLLGPIQAFREGEPCTPGLRGAVASQTNAAMEAVQVSAMNAVFFADSDGAGLRRAYGCLYGLENPAMASSAAIVPPWVSWIGRLQRSMSVMLIVLFGLGLRNMLKMK